LLLTALPEFTKACFKIDTIGISLKVKLKKKHSD
jgi:hypothetical protein